MITFTHPGYLLLLILTPFLFIVSRWWWRHSTQQLVKLSRHAGTISPRVRWQTYCLLLAFVSLCIALATPRWGASKETVFIRSRNVMLAVDVSRSMLAEDVRPNRLGKAKADLIDLVESLKGDRAGLLAFRGKGVLLCPLTSDTAYLRQSIDALAPDMAPPGETDLADAIAKCLEVFESSEHGYNAIVLISDGEDLVGHTSLLATRAGERSIPIFTIGIGSTHGAEIPDGNSLLKHEGSVVRSRLTEETLQSIAKLSGGRYIPLATAGTAQTTLGAVYERYLSHLATKEAREQSEQKFADRTGIFACSAALFCLIAGLLSSGRLGKWKFSVALLLGGTFLLEAQEPARIAQEHYHKKQYAEAAAAYAQAREGAEASASAHYAYNEALALWKLGDLTNAVSRVQMAIADRAFTARAATLSGTLHMALAEQATDTETRLTLRNAAINDFSRALRTEPSAASERNLSRALEGLEELRYAARKAAALKRYQEVPVAQLVPQLLHHQRGLMKAVPEVFNSSAPELRLRQAEQLATDVIAQSDRWFPILEALPQVVTNETLCLELTQKAKAAQSALDSAAKQYETLKSDATPLNDGEPFVYDFWKLFAQPDQLIDEAISVQTNALTSIYRYQPAREDEPEVLNLVQQFRVLFPNWAEQLLQQQAVATNEVAFTEAMRDEIARTADATVPLLNPPVSQENKQKVMDNLLKIKALLPKDPQEGSSQTPPSPPQEQPESSSTQSADPQPPEEKESNESEQAREPDTETKDLEALLQKAIDREREHEDEKRKRMQQYVRPDARDW